MPGVGIDRGAKTDTRQRRMWQRLARDTGASTSVPGFEGLTPTGGMVMWLTDTAPSGWLICNGDTIGLATGTHQGVQYQALFEVLKDVAPNAGTETWGTDTVELPNMERRVPMGAGGTKDTNGYGPTTGIGDTGGFESHQLQESEMPSHTHTVDIYKNIVNRGAGGSATCGTATPLGFATNAAGADGYHNNVQPSLVVNFIVKV